jgi:hypothetical protein
VAIYVSGFEHMAIVNYKRGAKHCPLSSSKCVHYDTIAYQANAKSKRFGAFLIENDF